MQTINGFVVESNEGSFLTKGFWFGAGDRNKEDGYVHSKNDIPKLKTINWQGGKPKTLWPAEYDSETDTTKIIGEPIDYEIHMQSIEGGQVNNARRK